MIKKRWIRIATLVIFLMTFVQPFTFAHNDPFAGQQIPGVSVLAGNISTGNMGSVASPMDMDLDSLSYATFNQTATVMYAPYPNYSAATAFYFTAGQAAYVMGRVYDCFYILWTTSEGKVMRGYVPVGSMNLTTYPWVSYDVFKPATCSATAPVLSGPGTTTSYYSIGEIYAGEDPLMVLGTDINPYNNVTYYYIQYQLSNGLYKRGWIDPRAGTVTIRSLTFPGALSISQPYIIKNVATGKVLHWDSNNNLIQKTMTGQGEQIFRINAAADTGYVKVLPARNTEKAMNVDTQMPYEGLPLKIATKTHPSKGQEFYIHPVGTDSAGNTKYALLTRCTGNFRSVEVYGGSSADGTAIIQSKYLGATHQQWIFIPVIYKKAQIFYDSTCTLSPSALKSEYDQAAYGIFQQFKICFDVELSNVKLSSQLNGGSCPVTTSEICSTDPNICGSIEECATRHHKGARLIDTVVDPSNDLYDCRIVGHKLCTVSYGVHLSTLRGVGTFYGKDTLVSINGTSSEPNGLRRTIQHELSHNLGADDGACPKANTPCIMNYNTRTENTWCPTCKAAIEQFNL